MNYMSDFVTAQNIVTRKVGEYKRHVVAKCKFLEEVPAGTKSFVPLSELVKSVEPETVEQPEPETLLETFDELEEDDA